MTWEEFEELTLTELEALEERRQIAIRHMRFNAGLIASVLMNSQRSPDSDIPPVSPFDFIAGYERDPREAENEKLRKSLKHSIALAFTEMRAATPEQVRAERAAMVARMVAAGHEDADELIREVFPDM